MPTSPGRSRQLPLLRGQLMALLKVALLAVVALAVFAVFALTVELRASLPRLDGELEVPGLTAPTVVTRDALGAVTVRGSARADIARATGFVHAQDRFFQMDGTRRLAAGELAALVGPDALAIDVANRLHRLRPVARESLARAAPEHRALLEAYTQGVNAGLAALHRPPPEYLLLPGEPEPWRTEDTLLVVLAMALQLTDETAVRDRTRGGLHEALPPALVDFLLPQGTEWDAPLDGSVAPPLASIPGADVCDLRGAAGVTIDEAELSRIAGDAYDVALGSNAWAVAGNRTASGQPLLANDMHLPLGVPNTWYRMRLVLADAHGAAPALDVVGATLPGTPAVVVGSNGSVAWGFTNSYGDWSDRVLLELHADDPGRYRTPTGWREFERRDELVDVAGGEPFELVVEQSVWGPVVERDDTGRATQALRWLAHLPEATDLSLLDMERARNVDEALAVAQRAGIPPQNFHVVDRDGTIAWSIAGRMPVRTGYDPDRPASAADGGGWHGWLEPARYPVIRSPEGGAVWSANSRVLGGEQLALIGSGNYYVGARARQIRDRLHALEQATPADMLALQLDDRARFLDRWRDLLLSTLGETAPRAAESRAAMRDLVEDWEGRAVPEAVDYRLVREFRGHVHRRVLGGVVGGCAAPGTAPTLAHERRREAPLWRLLEERPPHLLPAGHESWRDLLLAAVDEVVADCGAAPLGRCTWAGLNHAHIRHPFSLKLPWLAGWLDVQDGALPGDTFVPRVQRLNAGASERMAVSPGSESEGYFHMPGGQGGHPLSPFYSAGHRAWAEGTPLPLLPGETRHRLVLSPAR